MNVPKILLRRVSKEGKYAGLVMVTVLLLGVGVASSYANRGPWYAEYGAAGAIFAWMAGVAGGSFLVVAGLLRPRAIRSQLGVALSTLVLLVCLCAVAVTWFYPRPTVEGAEAALAAKDLDHALVELRAAEARGADLREAARVRRQIEAQTRERASKAPPPKTRDDRRLDDIGDGSLAVDTTLVLRREWDDPDKQALARKRVLERARAIADDAWAERDGPQLARIAENTEGIDEGFTAQCRQRAALAMADSCRERGEPECVRASLELFDTVDAETLAPELREELEALRADTNANTTTG